MGIYNDFLDNVNTVDTSLPREGISRVVVRQINALMEHQGDRDYPSGYAAEDEVQQIAVHEAGTDGGTFTLEFTLWDGTTFETAAIAYDATAGTIETAIDTAADGEVDGFTAGDISVSGGPLSTDPLVLTFDGASVAGLKHGLTVINSSLLDDATPTDAGEVTVTTDGQKNRTAWAILKECGAISGSLPVQGEAPTGLTAATNRATNPHLPDAGTLRALAHAAAVDDNNADVEDAILEALGLS